MPQAKKKKKKKKKNSMDIPMHDVDFSFLHAGSGEPLLLMERCRIKHLPSRRYLSVTQSDVEGKYNVCKINS